MFALQLGRSYDVKFGALAFGLGRAAIGARMPSAGELPPSLAPVAALQPLEIGDSEWTHGVERLSVALSRLSAESRRQTSRPAAVAE
jgi:hypothetical protein